MFAKVLRPVLLQYEEDFEEARAGGECQSLFMLCAWLRKLIGMVKNFEICA